MNNRAVGSRDNPRKVCYRCRRPAVVCLCAHITTRATRTRFVLLTHPMEAKKEKNGSGRVAHLSLSNSEIVVGVDFTDDPRVNELIAGSSDLAEILVRGSESLDQLSMPEALRFASAMTNAFNVVEHWHRQLVASGRFNSEDSELMAAVVRKRLIFPGIADWWQQNTDDFSNEFVLWVESVRDAA